MPELAVYARAWLQGLYCNPLYPGQKYFKHLWRGLNGDIDGDNAVGISDALKVIYTTGIHLPSLELGDDKIADIWHLLPDGKVHIMHAAVVGAHWEEYVP